MLGGHGRPQDPALLYSPDDVVGDLKGVVHIEDAGRVRRTVDTPEGGAMATHVFAGDALLRP